MLIMFAVLLVIAGWFVCGFISRCLVLGDFTAKYPTIDHSKIALFAWFFGPISLIVELCRSGKSFRLHAMTDDERWTAFSKAYPSLAAQGRNHNPYFD